MTQNASSSDDQNEGSSSGDGSIMYPNVPKNYPVEKDLSTDNDMVRVERKQG